jgi:A/G-specific adenine glycosylase
MEASVANPKPRRKHPDADAPSASALLAWYDRHARTLPWRVGPADRRHGIRPDPYRVWLSEIMLQQTTVRAVVPYFHSFLARWPTIDALAAADEADIMAAWAGLGYYSRARNLVACARALAARGRFPESPEGLRALPGIGAYTSAAIAAIAFDEPVAVVDGNVERVAARLFTIATPLPQAKAEIRDRIEEIVPTGRPGEFAEATMDLGATICTPTRPACVLCPWHDPCAARQAGSQTDFPVKAARKLRPLRHGTAFVARRADGAVLLRRRPPRGLLGGMSEVPGSEWRDGGLESETRATPPFAARWTKVAVPVAHGFTHFELRIAVERADVPLGLVAPEGHWWSAPDRLPLEALPTVMKKVIEAAYPGATRPVESTA